MKVNLIESLDLGSLDASRVVPLFYASLITHDPSLTIDQVTKLVKLRDLAKIFDAIVKAYAASLADPDQDVSPVPLVAA
jgi:hypothetical protein